MTRFGFRLVTALLALLIGGAALAQPGRGAPHIAASLVAETQRPRAGGTVTLAFAMTPAPGWHGYWKNPGDAGVETRAEWTLPKGVSAGPLAYPVPTTLIVGGLMNYVYEAPYAQPVTLSVPAGLPSGTRLPVRVKLDWLECTKEICVPATARLGVDLVVGDGAVAPAMRARFDRWRALLPRPLAGAARFARTGGMLRLAVPLPAGAAVTQPWFFPLTENAVDMAAAQRVTRAGDTLVIEVKAGGATPRRINGVLRIGPGRGLALAAEPGAVPAAGVAIGAADEAAAEGGGTLLAALGGALLGGLLLNVMPCVFPILSLKALGLAKGGGDERTVRREALAYAAGAVAVCVALGIVLLALRAGGSAAGWAFQLTDPRMILILMLLMLAIALNLAGLFELPMLAGGAALAGRGGVAGAFATGALAAFVATPCTGPFMAAALGAALVLPPAAALAVFAGLGLGLALPFLAIGFVPVLRRRLPRPGAWMATLRHILAVPMFLTAIGLAWVLGQQAGVDAMTLALAAGLLLALGLWWAGRRQARGRPIRAVLIPAAAAVAMAFVVPQVAATKVAILSEPPGSAAAEPFSEARLAALQAQRAPVFVYFTADWCLTCKVNEKTSIDRAEVRDAFARKGVRVLVGDWTDGDAAIGRFLAAHGRSGVPLYLWYAPGRGVQVLPQVLTPRTLTGLAA